MDNLTLFDGAGNRKAEGGQRASHVALRERMIHGGGLSGKQADLMYQACECADLAVVTKQELLQIRGERDEATRNFARLLDGANKSELRLVNLLQVVGAFLETGSEADRARLSGIYIALEQAVSL